MFANITDLYEEWTSDGWEYRVIFLVLWGLNVWTTYVFFDQLTAWDWLVVLGFGIGGQWLLTQVERPLYRGEFKPQSVVALLIDGFLNGGGIFFLIPALGGTDAVRAWADGLALEGSLAGYVKLAISFGLGLGLAYAPFWVKQMADDA